MQVSQTHYPHKLRLRVPEGLPNAVRIAARRANTSPSEWARRALLLGLQTDGLKLTEGKVADLQAVDKKDPVRDPGFEIPSNSFGHAKHEAHPSRGQD